MSKSKLASILLIVGWPLANIAIVAAIVAIDNWFLVSLVYPLIFGIGLPLLVLVAYWILVSRDHKGANWLILPIIASLVIFLCGAFHFFVLAIASASV